MPKVKSFTSTIRVGEKHNHLSVDMFVNVEGQFYCNLPDGWAELKGGAIYNNRNGKWQIFSSTADKIEEIFRSLHKAALAIKCTESLVIRYVFSGYAQWAEDIEGTIYPNACADGVDWVPQDDGPVRGNQAFSVHLAARVQVRKEYTAEGLDPRRDYAGLSQLADADKYPEAEVLDRWLCGLPARGVEIMEIPYTPDAALYFSRMLENMCRLRRMFAGVHTDQSILTKSIAEGTPLLEDARARD